MHSHTTILGGLYVALGLSGLLGGAFVLTSMIGGGLVAGDWGSLFIPAMGVAITLLILVFALPTLVGGAALLAGKPWARRFGILVAALNLVNFPIGTPVGAYGLWALSGDRRELDR
jgi:hypothetical protein